MARRGVTLLAGSPTMRDLARKIESLPRTVTYDIAQRVAPDMTSLASGAWGSGRDVYGASRRPGVDGRALTLVRTGTARALARFVAAGSLVRSSIGPRYAKYLIGRYRVLPLSRTIPPAWAQAIDTVATEVLSAVGARRAK